MGPIERTLSMERTTLPMSTGIAICRMALGMRSLLALLVVLSFGSSCFAQKTGTLRMMVDPATGLEFVVDHKYRMQQREVKLGEGLHHFSMWAPERRVVDTTVFVIADRTSDLVMRLPFSEEYQQYRKDLGRYEDGRMMRQLSPLVLVGGLVWTGLSIGSYGKAKDQLENDRTAYNEGVDPASINRLKIDIDQHNSDMRKARTSLYAGTALSVVGAGVIAYVWHKTKQHRKPSFEDKEKVIFEGLTWMPGQLGGTWCAGVTIPLQR